MLVLLPVGIYMFLKLHMLVYLWMIRLRSSSVLVIGMRGLGAEVCKNLVLAGIQALTVLDPNTLGPEDVAGRFLTQTEGENVRQIQSYSLQCACTTLRHWEFRGLGGFPYTHQSAYITHTHTHTHTKLYTYMLTHTHIKLVSCKHREHTLFYQEIP